MRFFAVNTSATYTLFLLDYLLPYFEHKRFKVHQEHLQFYRPTAFGHVSAILQLSDANEGQYLSFHLGLRHVLVEGAMAGLFGNAHYYHTESHTLLIDIRHLIAQGAPLPGRILITNEEQLKSAGDAFINFMDHKGLNFFEDYKTLKSIDVLYNQHTERSALWCNHHYQRCFRGMLSAIILKRNDLEPIAETHRIYLEQRGFGTQILQKFDAALVQLRALSLN